MLKTGPTVGFSNPSDACSRASRHLTRAACESTFLSGRISWNQANHKDYSALTLRALFYILLSISVLKMPTHHLIQSRPSKIDVFAVRALVSTASHHGISTTVNRAHGALRR